MSRTWIGTLLVTLLLAAGCGGARPRRIALYEKVTSEEGYPGRRYWENDRIMAEEYATRGEGTPIDLWRFYDDGRLLLVERDRNGDGRLDWTAHYDPDRGTLRALSRDTDLDGRIDLRAEYLGRRAWEQTLDRNHDGQSDFRFTFSGRPNLLSTLAEESEPRRWLDLRDVVPPGNWRALWLDTNGDGVYDFFLRYAGGQPVDEGVDENDDGEPDRWRRLPEGAAPPEARPLPSPADETPAPDAATAAPPGSDATGGETETEAERQSGEAGATRPGPEPQPEPEATVPVAPPPAPGEEAEAGGARAVPAEKARQTPPSGRIWRHPSDDLRE